MIFQQTWQKVMSGEKTQTRHVILPGELCSGDSSGQIFGVWYDKKMRHPPGTFIKASLPLIEQLYRLKWHVAMGYFRDKSYAVQPGRGKKSIGRIMVTAIRKERVQDISESDAMAEGVAQVENGLWVCYGDCDIHSEAKYRTSATASFMSLWDSINARRGFDWDSNPLVWVIEFKRLENGVL